MTITGSAPTRIPRGADLDSCRSHRTDHGGVCATARVNQAIGRLPAEVRQLGVTVQKASQNFVSATALFAPKGEYDALFLSNYIDISEAARSSSTRLTTSMPQQRLTSRSSLARTPS